MTTKLLEKPVWNYRDVRNYLGIGKTKAYEYMRIAREKYNGAVIGNTQQIKRDSLLLAIGTTIERELYIKNQIKERRLNEETL